jgi:NAD(P)-dependent dehydrogenase (short-subunit alcohol dehydrogenase family)
MEHPMSDNPTPRMTLATSASIIIRDEYMTVAAAEANTLGDDELRQRVYSYIAEIAVEDAANGTDWAGDKPNPASMSREEMIELLVNNAGGWPPTFAIPAGEDDPLVEDARELRREEWEQNVAATFKSMGLCGPAADRHRAAAEEAELAYLRRLTEETWELPEADLRVRALEIVAKLAGGTDGDKKFPHDPDALSRGHLLAAIADHINWLTWSPELRRDTRLAAE